MLPLTPRHSCIRAPSASLGAGLVLLFAGLAAACNFGLDIENPKDDPTIPDDTGGGPGPGTWYRDADGDGYGNPDEVVRATSQPTGYVADSTDCDDTEATAFPGGTEVCDGADNDCNGTVDDNPIDGDTWYSDGDLDSFGDPSAPVVACDQPSGTVTNTLDCDDGDPREPVIADALSGNTGGAGTVSDPVASLQAAIMMASGCVLAQPGTYAEAIDFGGRSITVTGIQGAMSTTIDPGTIACSVGDPLSCISAVTIASNSNASPTLAGFTIRGGSGATFYSSTSTTCADSAPSHEGQNTCTVHLYEYCGGGVRVEGDDPHLVDLAIVDNVLPDFTQQSSGSFEQIWRYSYGGGVCVQGGVVSLEGVTIGNNQADTGGGIYATNGSVLTLERVDLSTNIASDGGGVFLDGADLSATNALLACNQADVDGGGVFTAGGTVSLTNVSFYANACSTSGDQRGSELFQQGSGTAQFNNVVVQATSSVWALYGSDTGQFSYNDVYNSSSGAKTYGGSFTAGTRDINEDPSFTDAHCSSSSRPSFTLAGSSPAIDAGDPDAAYNDADGSRNDMGAYGGPAGTW
jgi:hypothetical protein